VGGGGCGLGALGTRCGRQRLERASSALLATLAARCPGGERDEELNRAARGGCGSCGGLGLVARRARLPAPLRGAGRWGGWTVGATAWLPTAMGHSLRHRGTVYPPCGSANLQPNASERGVESKMAWRSVSGEGGLCRCVRRAEGRPGRGEAGRTNRGAFTGLKAGPTKNEA